MLAIIVFDFSFFLFIGIVGVCFLVWSIVLGEADHGNLSLFLFLGLWVCVFCLGAPLWVRRTDDHGAARVGGAA